MDTPHISREYGTNLSINCLSEKCKSITLQRWGELTPLSSTIFFIPFLLHFSHFSPFINWWYSDTKWYAKNVEKKLQTNISKFQIFSSVSVPDEGMSWIPLLVIYTSCNWKKHSVKSKKGMQRSNQRVHSLNQFYCEVRNFSLDLIVLERKTFSLFLLYSATK